MNEGLRVRTESLLLALLLISVAALFTSVQVTAAHQPQPLQFYKDHPPCADAKRVIFPGSLYPYSDGMIVWVCE